ncbi:hypothetical protein HanXRQr2_Chr17g0805991 [Helianthus annuus]|uniref:Uncharacterized protein n=1 Tax=Helianthus annuus TaxID=4232 RepID=A0A251RSC5_HELAN|nr:hypothetical protein HanXRQr2_Chr17g0805991 [Helianthus annuus]KAJ0813367.1 hypothetical protein HanPSC8_Chr17g0772591 [Helianthus annuus]
MHQKKSEPQIGTDSTGISSDFNPNPIISSDSTKNRGLCERRCYGGWRSGGRTEEMEDCCDVDGGGVMEGGGVVEERRR